MVVVYIASPYTMGDVAMNVKRQIDTFNTLMNLGCCPVAPLLTHFVQLSYWHPYEEWVNIDNELLLRSDIVLRLPGDSKGADAEEKLARENFIPVVYSIDDLVALQYL